VKAFQTRDGQNQPPLFESGLDTSESLRNYIGEHRHALIEEVLAYCANHGKEVIIASVPAFDGLLSNPELGQTSPYQHHLRTMASYYQARFVDGYSTFDTVPQHRLQRYMLDGDAHWNRAGAELFAKHIADVLTSTSPSGNR
jgi:hypothetical protein